MGIKRQMPVADQVTFALHSRIQNGDYLPGDRLPSEQALADEFKVSRGTVRTALATLTSQGLVIRKQGDGTYLKDPSREKNSLMHAIWEFMQLIEGSGRVPSIEPVSIQRRMVKPHEKELLEMDHEVDVVSIERLFCADQKPIIFSVNIIPCEFFEKTVDLDITDAALGIHEFLSQYCQREIACVDVMISPVLPEDHVRAILSLDPLTPILFLEEIFRDITRVPLVLAENFYCDDKLSLQDVRPWHTRGGI